MACLNAVKCIPAVSNCSIPQNVEVATSIWLALHDSDKVVRLVLSWFALQDSGIIPWFFSLWKPKDLTVTCVPFMMLSRLQKLRKMCGIVTAMTLVQITLYFLVHFHMLITMLELLRQRPLLLLWMKSLIRYRWHNNPVYVTWTKSSIHCHYFLIVNYSGISINLVFFIPPWCWIWWGEHYHWLAR